MSRSRVLALSALLLVSCGDDSVTLTVDLVTDWRPGLDFSTAETTLSRAPDGTGEIRQETFMVTGAEDFVRGVRIAELDDVEPGKLYVRVALRDAGSRIIATRSLELTLENSFAAKVLVSRNCRDVACPAPMGAPELSECQGGSCVDPRCSPSTPEFCPPPECTDDAVCVATLTWCTTEPICADGYCFCRDLPIPPDTGPSDTGVVDTTPPPSCTMDAECGAPTPGAWSACAGFASPCAETGGTRTRDVTTPRCVGGTCTTEMSTESESCMRDTDGTACDDGSVCTVSDACAGGTCTGAARSCDDGNACTADSCNPTTGCVNSPMAEHSVCGATYQRCCGGTCVDTRSSTAHCGGCGINCAAGFGCVDYSGRIVCECAANTDCPGGADHICSPTYAYHCGCRTSAVCPGPMTCVDLAGELNYCTY